MVFSSVFWRTCVFTIPQELYEKSLLRVDDGTLCADLLEIRTFLTVPKVILSVRCCPLLFTNVTKSLYVLLQNLVNVMTMCPRHDLVSLNFGIKIGFRNKHKVSLCFFFFLLIRELKVWKYSSWALTSLTLKPSTNSSSKAHPWSFQKRKKYSLYLFDLEIFFIHTGTHWRPSVTQESRATSSKTSRTRSTLPCRWVYTLWVFVSGWIRSCFLTCLKRLVSVCEDSQSFCLIPDR